MDIKSLFKKKEEEADISFKSQPHLSPIKPREKYLFHSDYFDVDGSVATIMSYFHNDAANDGYGIFWGVNRIPSGLDDDISIICFEQIRRMSDGWVSDHQTRAEGVAEMNSNSQDDTGTNSTKHKAAKQSGDLQIIASELINGASYLNVCYRIMVKAPTVEKLDNAVKAIERLYIDRFGSLVAAPYIGEQRAELANLFRCNTLKRGANTYYFTSTEFAGSYSLVTHGLEDYNGEYVGYMVGDVNNSAVLFDVDGYQHHTIVANEQYNEQLGRVHVSNLWGSKISQSALLANHKVVHIILDGCKLDNLGPKFKNITYKIDMSHGDLNMFEMFGDEKDELSIFPAHMQKLILMAEQMYATTDSDRSIVRGSLESVLKKFYIENRMWYDNAANKRNKIRVVGIPHNQVPKLQMFVSYLETERKALINRSARDDEELHAMTVLNTVFQNMLTNNSDLFNVETNSVIDNVNTGRRVIYDFSDLMARGKGIAMAQLVNVIGFAVGQLGDGDVVIIHGTELIDDGVKDYCTTQFDRLHNNGGRVVYLYNKTSSMLKDKEFSQFDKADYLLLGNMTETIVKEYQESLGQKIPADLVHLVTNKGNSVCYIHRGFDNVVFKQDLALGLTKGKGRRRR